ncbi:MAG TPA: hypothetical protein VL576_02205 [Candidatus Paceibacterota bacterium]|jgi:hypothetical protein|nr:hypothetical protein [Candidatus Paceibacterota bacterium]
MIDREMLDKIILTDEGNNWWKPELFIKNTLPLLPKELEVLANPLPYDENYNCFIYALGLHNDKELLKETKGFIYDAFFQKLIDLGELHLTDEPQNGDWVLYKDMKNYPKMITHIGTLDNGKVISKWAWGPLIKHDLWDVPSSYGDNVQYVKAISPEQAKILCEKYKEFNVLPADEKSSNIL